MDKIPNNPIFAAPTEIDDQMVLKDGDVYKMWYQSENDHNIYYSVIIEGGLFKMWFSSEGMNGNIGYATSIDGITWEKYNGNPVIEDGELPSVIYDNGIYKMWYWSSGGIFYATSMDGIDWNKHSSNPVVQGDIWGPTVLKNNDMLEMWCESVYGFYYYNSSDGINWNPNTNNPIIVPTSSWENGEINDPSVIKDGDVYKLWFSSEDGLGYAEGEETGRQKAMPWIPLLLLDD